ncbi:hypothetical protein ABPG73_006295 [Tetrahymena malaccensis]
MEYKHIKLTNLDDLEQADKSTLTDIELYLNTDDMNKQQLNDFQSQLQQCTELQSLVIRINTYYLQDHQLQVLIENLSQFKNLNTVNLLLQGNRINEEGAKLIGLALKDCQQLKAVKLQLELNGIRNNGVQSILAGLNNCTLLESLELNISENQISDEGLEGIGLWKNYNSLTYLTLKANFNHICDKGCMSIATGIGNCSSLTSLVLSLFENNISSEGYLKVDQCLSSLPKLSKLECFFSGSEKLLKSRDLLNCKNIRFLQGSKKQEGAQVEGTQNQKIS